MTTEDQIIEHVQKHGRYHTLPRPFYAVQWDAKMYHAQDTRDLVIQICKAEGLKVRV
jgi:hypothetical protein